MHDMEIQLLVQSFRLALDIGDQRPAMHCLVIAGASVSNSRKEFIFAVFESDSICALFVQDLRFNFATICTSFKFRAGDASSTFPWWGM